MCCIYGSGCGGGLEKLFLNMDEVTYCVCSVLCMAATGDSARSIVSGKREKSVLVVFGGKMVSLVVWYGLTTLIMRIQICQR